MKNTKKILIIFLITLISLLNYSFGAELPKDVIASVPANTIVSLSSQTVNTKTEFYLVLNLSI